MNNWQLISYDESSKSTSRAFCTPVLSLLDELYHEKRALIILPNKDAKNA